MRNVYGSSLVAFPEIIDTITVWSEENSSDKRYIRGVFIPEKGDGIKRRKYTSGNTGLDIVEDDKLFVFVRYKDSIKVGDYLVVPDVEGTKRVTKQLPFDKASDFIVFLIERVTGSFEKNGQLNVKEGTFD